MLVRLPLILLLLSRFVFAAEYFTLVDYFGSQETKSQCDQLIVSNISKFIAGDFKPLDIGGFVMMEKMLETAGVDRRLRAEFINKVAPIRRLYDTDIAELNELNKFLDENSHKLFMCVLPKGCDITSNTDLRVHGFYLPTGKTRLLLESGVKGTKDLVKSKALGLPREIDQIVVNHPSPAIAGSGWLGNVFFHEMRHFMDYEFLSKWVKANQLKMNRGERPDALFAKYLQIVVAEGNGKSMELIVMDHGFYLAFLETNAYKVGFYAHNLSSGPGAGVLKEDQERLAYSQIAATPSGRKILSEFGYSKGKTGGILELGKTLYRLMQPTVDAERGSL